MTDEHFLDMREKRRLADDRRWEERRQKLEEKAEKLVGQLIREGDTIYYINIRKKDGTQTGLTKEFDREYEAIDYLIRNKYV